jgi:hypothetical protein
LKPATGIGTAPLRHDANDGIPVHARELRCNLAKIQHAGLAGVGFFLAFQIRESHPGPDALHNEFSWRQVSAHPLDGRQHYLFIVDFQSNCQG